MITALVNLVIAITVAEICWLMFIARHRLPKLPLLANLAAGLALLIALRLSLASADLAWIALALSAAGLAHLMDLKARWKAATGDALSG